MSFSSFLMGPPYKAKVKSLFHAFSTDHYSLKLMKIGGAVTKESTILFTFLRVMALFFHSLRGVGLSEL